VSQPTYTITGIAPGTYYVLAYRNDNNPGIGVYTQYTVKCQQATQETVSRIDITDWQFQQNGYPARPR
jgi:hypothetical protein